MNAAFSKFSGHSRRFFFGLSPWLIVGLSAVLTLAVILLAIRNTAKEWEHITQNLLDRADALIWALEAGTRTGIGFGEERRLVQSFMEETARQRDIAYIAIVDANGRILAHSNADEIGRIFPPDKLPAAEPPKEVAWRTHHAGHSAVFEVYREFSPIPGYHFGGHGHNVGYGGKYCDKHMSPHRHVPANLPPPSPNNPPSLALIGFDRKPFDDTFAKHRFNNIVTAFVASLLGLGSFFSIFWAHHYQRSRRLLKDSRALASEVVTSMPMGLITCAPDGTINTVNETALAMLRIDRTKAIGMPIHGIPGLDWKAIITTLGRKQKIVEREMELFTDGESHPTSLSASQILDEDGLFLGHLFILGDIAEMKRLQREAQRNDRLAALGNLAAGVAHEIRNPLSSIKGLATYLSQKMNITEPEEEAAKTMVLEVERLNRVVSQLLEFAKPSVMKLAVADVHGVIARALRLADADIQAKKIRVDFTENTNLPQIVVNGERLTQAVLNLLLNAVQAMDTGGTLGIVLEAADQGGMFRISVADNGKGMSQETQSAIFTPYFTTKTSGTGLGLAIVQQVVEGHGGNISVKSALGVGSTFTLNLPVKSAAQEAL